MRPLRLLRDGRIRWETLVIDASSPDLRARVYAGGFRNGRWRLKSIGEGRAPVLCLPDDFGEICYAFHAQFPGNDLLLFGADANWGEPTLTLRRQTSSPSFAR